MKRAPASPSELRQTLRAIFQSLPRDFGIFGESVIEDPSPTFQSVLREFVYFFARDLDQFSKRQIRRFADLVATGIETPGALEHALVTCFLEPMHQLGVESRLRPFLSQEVLRAAQGVSRTIVRSGADHGCGVERAFRAIH